MVHPGNIFIFCVCTVVPVYPGTRSTYILKKTLTKGKKVFWVGGTFSYLAYVVTVWAFTKAPIPMVSALRESSIIFAILIGYFYLKDKISFYKVASISLIFLGVLGLKLF